MAEGTSVNQDNIACRFFLSGFCKDSSDCLFSHDPSRQVPDTVCRYYLQDKCIFGLNCRYDHILINEVNTSKTISESTSADPSKYSLLSNTPAASNWINAPVFVPKYTKSYADAIKANTLTNNKSEKPSAEICSFFAEGNCPVLQCRLIHGNICEICNKAYLHPFNEEARKSHIEKCGKEIEENMKYSFAMQRSLNEICGICMEVVLQKNPISERRFGILENCNHVYCLSCIRKWRRSRQYENNQLNESILDPENIRSCPECRIGSNFIIPSTYFIDTVEEKEVLITEYKAALNRKQCKYFNQGEGVCPFGGSCFYLHAKPDGTKVDLPVPTRRYRKDKNGDLDYMEVINLWDYVEHRERNAVAWITDIESSDSSD